MLELVPELVLLLALFDAEKHDYNFDNFEHNKIKREHEISQVLAQMFTNIFDNNEHNTHGRMKRLARRKHFSPACKLLFFQ